MLLDPKIVCLTQSDIRQMLLYAGHCEGKKPSPQDSPHIGLSLRIDEDELVVPYALSGSTQQDLVFRDQLRLPSEEELHHELEEERDVLLEVGCKPAGKYKVAKKGMGEQDAKGVQEEKEEGRI